MDIEQGPDGRYTVAIMGNGLAPKVTLGPMSSEQVRDLFASADEVYPSLLGEGVDDFDVPEPFEFDAPDMAEAFPGMFGGAL